MARKQSDYLAGLLADEAPAPAESPAIPLVVEDDPSPAPHIAGPARASNRAGLSLLGRENALARAASGEVRQVTQLLINPARVRLWAGNARIQERLSVEAVQDLIDSILAEGGQKVPVVVRHVSGDPDYDYEVIAGTRRHFAISWLRANSYPEMKLLAQVADTNVSTHPNAGLPNAFGGYDETPEDRSPIWMTRQLSVSPTLRTARARMSRISSERATMLRRLKPIMAARRCAWPNA